jgi:hypothetical protein
MVSKDNLLKSRRKTSFVHKKKIDIIAFFYFQLAKAFFPNRTEKTEKHVNSFSLHKQEDSSSQTVSLEP